MKAHRRGDARACGATTVVEGQDFMTVEGQLWAVQGDPNTDGGGGLNSSHPWITINGKGVIVAGDSAEPDSLCPIPPHCEPSAVGFSDLTDVA